MTSVIILLASVATAFFVLWRAEAARATREADRADHYRELEMKAMDTIMTMRQKGFEGPNMMEEPEPPYAIDNEYELEVERAQEEDREPDFPDRPLELPE